MRQLVAKRIGPLLAVLALSLALTSVAPAGAQPVLGQADNFEDGTTQGWTVGGAIPGVVHPAPPVNIATGGPGGAGDNYLQITAVGGAGPGSKLSAFNMTQWAGSYLAAGIGAIQMDLRNFGPSDVSLRLLFANFAPPPPPDIAVTSTVIHLPAGGLWTRAIFPITADALVPLVGTPTNALSNSAELRLFHNPAPVFLGPGGASSPAVQVLIGVDNITAIVAIPEPSTVILLGSGVLALAALRRRTTRRG